MNLLHLGDAMDGRGLLVWLSDQMLSGYGYYKIRSRGYYRFIRFGDTWTGFFET
jgi:hypothetical protein